MQQQKQWHLGSLRHHDDTPDLQKISYPSAREGISRNQTIGFAAGLFLLSGLVLISPNPLAMAALLLSPVFLMLIVLQIGLSIDSLSQGEQSAPVKSRENEQADWPIYTMLVPLLREDTIIPQLCDALCAIDYPQEQLDILFLVESHDRLTWAALQKQDLPAFMRVIIVPPGQPQTKPRALNHGLIHARGDYITVYDAEDIPDSGQLKQAVQMFQASPSEVLCLQAHLVIDNSTDSWLAMMMLIEYAGLFEIIKPGLARSGLPVALGGTSNHFRSETLRRLCGWDAYNVTEDADMGFRIARMGGVVGDLASDTMEEAPVAYVDWVGQRRRWLKGWMQTGLSHSQNPRRVITEMGLTHWLVAMAQVIGVIAGTLLFPFFSLWLGWNLWHGTLFQAESWLDIASNSIAIVVFLAGLAAMLLPAILGLRKRRLWHLMPWLITLPAYQCLVFWAACLALLDIIRRPFHWEKTRHGVGERMQMVRRRKP